MKWTPGSTRSRLFQRAPFIPRDHRDPERSPFNINLPLEANLLANFRLNPVAKDLSDSLDKKMWRASINTHMKWSVAKIFTPLSEGPTESSTSRATKSSSPPASPSQVISLGDFEGILYAHKSTRFQWRAIRLSSSQCSSSPRLFPSSPKVSGSPLPTPLGLRL